jgi:signal peptidase II
LRKTTAAAKNKAFSKDRAPSFSRGLCSMALQAFSVPPATSPSGLGRARRLRAYGCFLGLIGGVVALDQLTKFEIRRTLPLGTYGPPEHVAIIPGFFNLVHVGNTGAAWSMFSGRSSLLALLAIGTLLAIVYWRHSLGLRQLTTQLSFGLLCGGISGNLIDRVAYGHVVDFLDFHFGNYIFPTFNIADSCICIGVAIYLWQSFQDNGKAEPKKAEG